LKISVPPDHLRQGVLAVIDPPNRMSSTVKWQMRQNQGPQKIDENFDIKCNNTLTYCTVEDRAAVHTFRQHHFLPSNISHAGQHTR